ncbi:hypothetical protein CCHL11_08828 [Colletotrichum chlorophyti]|uniref:Uncharacterized protein n=1 Tax=Colletotrichum chlorophyti TaxID=708187 RepID=A0A1Q8RZ80_9PEZI|nr:hypothetical protein CCHL11_08828 [Colletotrichum chlorophyti]
MVSDNHISTSTSKGKEKEVAAPTADISDGSQDGSSFVARLATSATNLSRSALTGRLDPEGLQSGASSKSQPMATFSSSSSVHESAHRGATAVFGQPNTRPSADSAFASSRQSSSATGDSPFRDFMQARASVPYVGHPSNLPSDVKEQEARDGQEIVDLLNGPGDWGDYGYGDDDDSNFQTFISPQEEISLRMALFSSNEKRVPCNWDSLLNFEPDYLQGNDKIAEIHQHFGVADARKARAMWMDSWSDVLTSYTDEVWGDLGSLAREAHREIQEARVDGGQETDTGGMRALLRLRQILAHVRGH